ALHFDGAAAVVHDAVDHGEAEPSAFAHLLGGEEGLEDAGARRFTHSFALVANREPDHRLVLVAGRWTIDVDLERTPVFHGVDAVHRQVGDDLLQLRSGHLRTSAALRAHRDRHAALLCDGLEHAHGALRDLGQ